ncbi:MAG: hypothetical protein ABJA82_03585 [Myxococcales bacterium]
MQVAPEQQPLGQDCGVQVQAPATQVVPPPQAALAPQRHSPVMAQLSAREASQVTQAAPPVPQALAAPAVVQVGPEQQPLAQVAAVQFPQAPPEHISPRQSWQFAPPLPQLALAVPGRQVLPEQQPLAHAVLSQTQAPPTQCWPVSQGAPLPHWQAPAEQRSAVIPQARQAPPAAPQLVSEAARQVVPEQHPPGHEVASHTQLPARQRCPVPQADPAPHAHMPASVQRSVNRGSQATQAAPAAPHLVAEGATQTPKVSQQPLGQEAASQLQCPPRHFNPVVQAGPVPHEHPPDTEHPSAFSMSQPTQAAPARPQAVGEGTLQVGPEQHPLGQVTPLQPLHRPFVHTSAVGQASHVLPPAPHELAVSPGRQAPPEQHPFGHDVPSHTQVLPIHRWPSAQVFPVPQRQFPLAEQLSARLSHTAQVDPASPQVSSDRTAHTAPSQQPLGQEVASQMHCPPAQRWPPAHGGAPPHRHSPPNPQRSARVVSQGMHAVPFIPQFVREGRALQASPLQQPVAQESASHRQTPFMHRWPAAQAALPPQRQAPFTEQVSTLSGSHPVQAAPPVPQVVMERG